MLLDQLKDVYRPLHADMDAKEGMFAPAEFSWCRDLAVHGEDKEEEEERYSGAGEGGWRALPGVGGWGQTL